MDGGRIPGGGESALIMSGTRLRRFPFGRVASITAAFVGAYFVLRALPDAQCGFLLYEEVVNEDGEVEFCATNHAGFLDLTKLKYPMSVALDVADSESGKAVTLDLETKGGMPIAPHELAVTHTKKMHVMVIDSALEDYHHVHPEPEGIGGRYRFVFRPERDAHYRVFTEIVPVRTRRQAVALNDLPLGAARPEPEFEKSTQYKTDGVRFRLREVPETLRKGRDYRFELDVDGADGRSIELEEVMGAKGHMVAFDEAGRGFAHMHPIDSVLGARPTGAADQLAFLFNVPNPGWYRLFAQVRVGGEDVYGRFDLRVE